MFSDGEEIICSVTLFSSGRDASSPDLADEEVVDYRDEEGV